MPDIAWGKFYRSGDEPSHLEWHPLVDHCADVAATLEALLNDTLLGERLFLPARLPLRDERLIQRLSAIAFLHDLGKANRGFQSKIHPEDGSARPRPNGHVRELWPLLCDSNATDLQRRLSEALPAEALCAWVEGEALLPLLVAAVSHHGTPWDSRGSCRCDHLWRPADGYDPFAAVAEMGEKLPSWFPAAFTLGARVCPMRPSSSTPSPASSCWPTGWARTAPSSPSATATTRTGWPSPGRRRARRSPPSA